MHNPPPCECEIWHYNQVNVDHIRKAVDLFPWKKALRNLNISDTYFVYLTKRLSTFLIIFLMKQLHLIIEILRELKKKNAKQFVFEKNEAYKRYV